MGAIAVLREPLGLSDAGLGVVAGLGILASAPFLRWLRQETRGRVAASFALLVSLYGFGLSVAFLDTGNLWGLEPTAGILGASATYAFPFAVEGFHAWTATPLTTDERSRWSFVSWVLGVMVTMTFAMPAFTRWVGNL